MPTNHDGDDPLSRRLREVEELSRRVHEDAARSSSQQGPGGRLHGWLHKAKHLNGFYAALMWLLRAVKWTSGWFSRLASGLVRMLKWSAFRRANGDFVRNSEGELLFSSRRLATVSAIAVTTLLVLHATLSATYFHLTQFEELVYTTGKQEIVTGELYQFTGCTSLPCSTDADNGKFYEIENSWYFPHLIYPEEDVFANIPQQDGACYVKGYGLYFRRLSALHKSLQWYQKAYSVSCRPYTEEEKQRAVELGIVAMPAASE